jgi:predicted unusual protein kinase regulating ubiquinone biosynthesis (AarF/ABC1/UbiB family)
VSNRRDDIRRGSLSRSLTVGLAGLRAGGALALDGALGKLRGADSADSEFAKREARRFVTELGRLKGTYVKIGQMMALLGEHFLPSALTAALHELASDTEPLPWRSVRPALEGALGERMAELDIEPQAIAAASLAQVHRATVKSTGEQICLKVQYPGLAEVIDADFDNVVRMLVLARWVKAGKDLDRWLEDLRVQLHQEIDYPREIEMTRRVAALVADIDAESSAKGVRYRVPRIYDRYSSDQVIAMEYLEGHVATQAEVAALPQARRDALARAMLELFFYELYDWGVLQTDPNFGNYLIRCAQGDAEAPDELALLDFGSILHCEDYFLDHLCNCISGGQAGDRELVADSLIGLDCLPADATPAARDLFTDFCMHLLEPLRPPEDLPAQYLNERGEYCWARSGLLRRAGRKAAISATSPHFNVPAREFAMIARKLTGVFTFISVLNAEFNAYEIVQDHIERWARDHSGGEE